MPETGPVDPGEPVRGLCWPLVTQKASVEPAGGSSGADVIGEAPTSVLEHTGALLRDASPSLVALEPTAPDLIGLVVIGGCVWLTDGRPGIREPRYVLRRPITAIQS